MSYVYIFKHAGLYKIGRYISAPSLSDEDNEPEAGTNWPAFWEYEGTEMKQNER
jgi:hypothetical protein